MAKGGGGEEGGGKTRGMNERTNEQRGLAGRFPDDVKLVVKRISGHGSPQHAVQAVYLQRASCYTQAEATMGGGNPMAREEKSSLPRRKSTEKFICFVP